MPVKVVIDQERAARWLDSHFEQDVGNVYIKSDVDANGGFAKIAVPRGCIAPDGSDFTEALRDFILDYEGMYWEAKSNPYAREDGRPRAKNVKITYLDVAAEKYQEVYSLAFHITETGSHVSIADNQGNKVEWNPESESIQFAIFDALRLIESSGCPGSNRARTTETENI